MTNPSLVTIHKATRLQACRPSFSPHSLHVHRNIHHTSLNAVVGFFFFLVFQRRRNLRSESLVDTILPCINTV